MALAALGTAGCGGGGNSEGPSGERVVTVQLFGDAEELGLYRQVARAYEKRSGARVRLIEVPDRDSHLAKLTTSFAAGRPPDVFLLNYRNYGPFVSRKVIDPAERRLDASDTLDRDDFYPSPIDAFTVGGELQCLPQNASSLVVYVNKDFFAAAAVALPRGAWTYDEFFRAALELRAQARRVQPPGSAHALGIDPNVVRLAPFVWGAGGELVDDEAAPKRFDLRTPAAQRGIARFLSFYREALVPDESAVESQGLDARFQNGQLAMFMSSRREVPAFRKIDDFEWDVVPFPRAERAASVLHSDAFCLSRGPGADAGWRFVEFAGGPDGQRLLARGGRIVPSLREVAESGAFLGGDEPPRSSRVFLDALDGLRRLPSTANWPRIEDSASLAFKRAFYAELTPEAAIGRIEAETNGLF